MRHKRYRKIIEQLTDANVDAILDVLYEAVEDRDKEIIEKIEKKKKVIINFLMTNK